MTTDATGREPKLEVVSHLPAHVKLDAVARLARIEGHVRAVRTMVNENKPCDDLLTQLAAIRAASTQVAVKLFEGHVETCVRAGTPGGGEADVLARVRESIKILLRQSGV